MSDKIVGGFQWLANSTTGDPSGLRRPSDGKEFPFSSLVSGGGIAYATLASTPGTTPGERRTLSDGPDKGSEIIWSIPEGSTSYAWCWAIYPLASYL